MTARKCDYGNININSRRLSRLLRCSIFDCKILIPASIVLHIVIGIVLAFIVVELSSIH